MNIPNTKKIAKIDSKEVNIKAHWQERIHVTTILWIVADGPKLYPILVFKSQEMVELRENAIKNSLVKDKKYLLIIN